MIVLIVFVVLILQVGGDILEEKMCGNLYSSENFTGNMFSLWDRDNVVNTRMDYRSSVSGWRSTGSIRVKENCVMTLCTGTHFRGSCKSYENGHSESNPAFKLTLSVNCSCEKICRCEDVALPNYEDGRAYLNEGCSICDSEYIVISGGRNIFPFLGGKNVSAVVLRKGCKGTVYNRTSIPIGDHFVQGLDGLILYNIDCNIDQFTPRRRTTPIPTALENLSTDEDEILEMVSRNYSSLTHPGIRAAITSYKSGRSSTVATILVIGKPDRLRWMGALRKFHATTSEVLIQSFPVLVDELGIANAEIQLISMYGLGEDRSADDDYRWLATLEEHILSSEDGLNTRIPNVVIIAQNIDEQNLSINGSKLQRKLSGLNLLRELIVDEHFSNVLFLFVTSANLEVLDVTVPKFQNLIGRRWGFPKPIHVVVDQHRASGEPFFNPRVNGYKRMEDGQYFPKTVYDAMKLICEKGGDPLGRSVFRAALEGDGMLEYEIMKQRIPLLNSNHSLVERYKQRAINSSLQMQSQSTRRVGRKRIQDVIRISSTKTVIDRVTSDEIELLKSKIVLLEAAQASADERITELEKKVAQSDQMIAELLDKYKAELLDKIKVDLSKLFE